MNTTLSHALTTFDRIDRESRSLALLEPAPLDLRAYHAKRDTMSSDWLVVARRGRECLRLSSGTADAQELAERAATQLNRRARGQ